jgi:hypothetical protein
MPLLDWTGNLELEQPNHYIVDFSGLTPLTGSDRLNPDKPNVRYTTENKTR